MEISIIALPLIASIISGFFGKFIGDRNSEIITSLLVSISAILSAFVLYEVIVNQYQDNITIATWISSGSLNVNWSMKIDALSAVMLVVVTSVSALVHIYSIGYMSHDPHKPRFMAYLSLFTFAMLMLVTSDNFIQLFFGWEGVGLCSYFLIGFWFKKESANKAAIKAFVVNRVGDFGFALGIFLIFYLFIDNIIILMTSINSVIVETQNYALWIIVSPLISFLSFQMDGIFIGANKTRIMRNTVIISFIIFIISLCILVPIYENNGLWLSFILFLFLRGVLLVTRFKEIFNFN